MVERIDPDVAAALHAEWRDRIPRVIELHPGAGLDDPLRPPADPVEATQPWEWPVDLDLPGERLHHAVWANSEDGRRGGRTWRWAGEARRAGAGPGRDGADVTLPDGRLALCDGGPLAADLEGRAATAVLHRVSVEHGFLDPLAGTAPTPSGRLAADQSAAVGEPRAGARVLAPAGSGKTRVLTERARALVSSWGLPPAALALIAYNVRAADEMRQRLTGVPGLRIRTLNALGLRLSGRSTTLDEPEVRRVLARLVNFPRRAEADPAAPWIEALSRIRLSLSDPAEVESYIGDVSDLDRVARAFRSELAQRDAVDFDEQVVAAIDRLLHDVDFRLRSQRFARVLLVDEFQDLTPAHLLLIRLLSGPAGAVFAVGDDDQTIYGYAGATPRWLVDYQRWFPGSASHTLEVNYRCPPAVVEAAANLLTRNAVRVPKEVRPARPSGGELTVLPAGPGPAAVTTGRVGGLIDAGVDPADIAVLARVNASLVPVQVLLGHRSIPVNSSGDRRFSQRSGVRGALAWLEVAAAPPGQLPGAALREAARRPKRGMSNSLLDLLGRPRSAESLASLPAWLTDKGSVRDAERVERFVRDVTLVRRAAGRGTAAILEVVRHQVGGEGLDASASALDGWSHGAIAAHGDDLDALSELAALEPDPGRFPLWLADQLSVASDDRGVTVASIHAVKGREWPHVVIHHATAGLIPHRLAGDVEEERRIFHVGLTRAIESATVVPGPEPSPFLAELLTPGRPTPTAPPTAGDPGRGRQPGEAPLARSGGEGPATHRRSGTRPGPAGGGSPAELLPGRPGTVFDLGGHPHEVVSTGPRGVVCLVGGGPARTSVEFGTVVVHDAKSVVLAHPGAEAAFAALREWRATRARAMQVPAYVVFDDATLRAVAVSLPTTEAALLAVRGIGPAKLEAYGSDLLALAEELRSSTDGVGGPHPPS